MFAAASGSFYCVLCLKLISIFLQKLYLKLPFFNEIFFLKMMTG